LRISQPHPPIPPQPPPAHHPAPAPFAPTVGQSPSATSATLSSPSPPSPAPKNPDQPADPVTQTAADRSPPHSPNHNPLAVSTPTANSLIKALIDKQIVVEITDQQRGRVYSFNRYISLFVS